MRAPQTCVGCGKPSPETETNYTLISAQFGWRLTRYKNADGTLVIEWRCPTCWREHKRARAVTSSAPNRAPIAPSAVPSSGAHPTPVVARPPTLGRPRTPFEAFRAAHPAHEDSGRADPPPSSERRSPTPPPRGGTRSSPTLPSPGTPPPGRSGRGSR